MGVRLVAAISSSRDLPPFGDWLIAESAPVAAIRLTKTKILALLQLFCFQTSGSSGAVPRGGARRTQRGTVSGVGLGSMVWRRYGAVGRYAHSAMEWHRCSVAKRHGYGVVGQYVPGIMERHGRNGVKRRERGAVGWCRCGAWSERGAAPWDGADSVLWGAPAVTS